MVKFFPIVNKMNKSNNQYNHNNNDILIMYGLMGSLIIIGYIMMMTNKNADEIWSNKGSNIILTSKGLLTIYKIMITLSFIAGLYLIFYLYKACPKYNIIIYTGSVFLLLFSTIWAFNPFFYSKFVLGLVFIGSVLILAGICLLNDIFDIYKIAALVSISILVVQTGLFDFGIWTGNIMGP